MISVNYSLFHWKEGACDPFQLWSNQYFHILIWFACFLGVCLLELKLTLLQSCCKLLGLKGNRKPWGFCFVFFLWDWDWFLLFNISQFIQALLGAGAGGGDSLPYSGISIWRLSGKVRFIYGSPS